MSGALTKPTVVKPGASLIQAGRALEDKRRQAGVWPYQWLFPGPHSKHVLYNQYVNSPGPGAQATIGQPYVVPEGLRFSLRGIVFGYFGTSAWDEGTTEVEFSLQVVGAGSRNVDYLQNVRTHLGSADQPYPILGRLEFEPLNQLSVLVVVNSVIALWPPNTFFAHLVGHTYPNSERDG